MRDEVLGVDIGGVIIDRVNDESDTSFFSDNYLLSTEVQDVFETLADLRKRFKERIHLVSKCGKRTQEKTLNWLNHKHFYDITGIATEKVWFCRERKGKAPICERLGVTHFVDDRLEILGSLNTVDSRYLFRPNEEEVLKFAHHLPLVKRVNEWREIRAELL